MELYDGYGDNSTPNLPEELKKRPQWVAWRYSGRKKEPINPRTGRNASATDPKTWASFDEAVAHAADGPDGVGFAVSLDDPFCFVDLDDCIVNGEVEPWAFRIVERFDSYTEISPSGKGLKIWIRGTKPGDRCRGAIGTGGVEMYDSNHYSTVTGRVFRERPVGECQTALEEFYWEMFPRVPEVPDKACRATLEENVLPDEELLKKARSNKRTGAEFKNLYDFGSTAGYPSPSEADAALFKMLAFWTGGDLEQMERLARRSALMRPKWDERRAGGSYLRYSLQRILDRSTKRYDRGTGEALKERVRSIAASFQKEVSRELDPDSTGAKVLDLLLQTAAMCGKYRDGEVEFNANQGDIAGEIGISRRGVGKAIERLQRRGLIERTKQGNKKVGNSVYRLGSTGSSPIYTQSVELDSSSTYFHGGG